MKFSIHMASSMRLFPYSCTTDAASAEQIPFILTHNPLTQYWYNPATSESTWEEPFVAAATAVQEPDLSSISDPRQRQLAQLLANQERLAKEREAR